jgi:glycosyltransferase involved in cell wall biosynthesis
MKILAISQFYTPDITAAAFRIAETIGHLRAMDNEVEVVTTFPHKSDSSRDIPRSKNGVHRVHLPKTEGQGFLGYIYIYLSFLIKSVFRGFIVGLKQKPEIIWASSPPIFVGLAGWILSKVLGAGFALDIRDIWPDSAVAADQISDSGFAYKVGKTIEKFLYKHADLITCVAEPMKRYIQTYTETDIHIIYNGVDVDKLDVRDIDGSTNILNKYATNSEAKKILYAGNFGHVQELDLLIKAVYELDIANLNNAWEVFFLGAGAKETYLRELVESMELKGQIHFLDPVPKEEVFDYLQAADALFIHLQDSEVLRLTIPSKVFDYMLANRPLLSGIYGEGREIIGSVEGNFVFDSGSKEQLQKSLKKLDKAISINGTPENAIKVRSRFSRKNQSKKLHAILQEHFT